MYSVRDDAALPAPGCPIRESAVQRLFNTSSRLIAVVHALHRLLMPRHPPCALTILTVILLCRPPTWRPPGGRHFRSEPATRGHRFRPVDGLTHQSPGPRSRARPTVQFSRSGERRDRGGLPRPVSQNSAARVRKGRISARMPNASHSLPLRVSARLGRHAKDVLERGEGFGTMLNPSSSSPRADS